MDANRETQTDRKLEDLQTLFDNVLAARDDDDAQALDQERFLELVENVPLDMILKSRPQPPTNQRPSRYSGLLLCLRCLCLEEDVKFVCQWLRQQLPTQLTLSEIRAANCYLDIVKIRQAMDIGVDVDYLHRKQLVTRHRQSLMALRDAPQYWNVLDMDLFIPVHDKVLVCTFYEILHLDIVYDDGRYETLYPTPILVHLWQQGAGEVPRRNGDGELNWSRLLNTLKHYALCKLIISLQPELLLQSHPIEKYGLAREVAKNPTPAGVDLLKYGVRALEMHAQQMISTDQFSKHCYLRDDVGDTPLDLLAATYRHQRLDDIDFSGYESMLEFLLKHQSLFVHQRTSSGRTPLYSLVHYGLVQHLDREVENIPHGRRMFLSVCNFIDRLLELDVLGIGVSRKARAYPPQPRLQGEDTWPKRYVWYTAMQSILTIPFVYRSQAAALALDRLQRPKSLAYQLLAHLATRRCQLAAVHNEPVERWSTRIKLESPTITSGASSLLLLGLLYDQAPAFMLRACLRSNPHCALARNALGQCALHVVLTDIFMLRGIFNLRTCRSLSSHAGVFADFMNDLIRWSAEALLIPDPVTGLFPLQLAVALVQCVDHRSNKRGVPAWKGKGDLVPAIASNAPIVLTRQCAANGLFPFQLPASPECGCDLVRSHGIGRGVEYGGEGSDERRQIGLVYTLLRIKPDVLPCLSGVARNVA